MLAVALGAIGALLIVTQAWLLARVIAGAVADGEGLGALATALGMLLAVVIGRATLAWAVEVTAHRSSAQGQVGVADGARRTSPPTSVPTASPCAAPAHLTVLATRGSTRSTATSRATCRSWCWP